MADAKQPRSGKGGTSSEEWAHCFYRAYNRRDWEWVTAMLAEDVVWVHAARDESVRGITAVLSLLQSGVAGYPDAEIQIQKLHAAGGFVIAECSYGASRATFCEVFQIEKGRCVRGNTYADSVRTVMELSVAPKAA